MVSCGTGGLVVAHVGRRLLLGRAPRQCAMPRHNGDDPFLFFFKEEKKRTVGAQSNLLTRPRRGRRQDVWSKNGKSFLKCVRWVGCSERKREERTEAVG